MASPLGARSLPRVVRRHRRIIAAVLAGGAVLAGIGAVREPAPTVVAVREDPSQPRTGEMTVPVLLDSAAVASVLRTGDVVDLIAVGESGEPDVVAQGARVLERNVPTGGLGGSSSGLLVVAVPEAQALEVAAAATTGLTVVIRERAALA